MERSRRHKRILWRIRKAGITMSRICVFRSAKHIYGQIIDDIRGGVIIGASSLSPELKAKLDGKKKTEVAFLVGELLALRAQKKGIKTVCFDRAGYKYHGRVKALADGVKKGGLKIGRA